MGCGAQKAVVAQDTLHEVGVDLSKQQLQPSPNGGLPPATTLSENRVEPREREDVVKPGNFVQNLRGNIADLFEIRRPPLGAGAYGEVCKAISRSNGHSYAIKIIRRNMKLAQSNEDLVKEVHMIKSLDHPHIIKIYEFMEDKRNIFIVTELCEGGELFDVIIGKGHLSEHDAAVVMKQLLQSLCYLHKRNIAHRDLKPENLLLEAKDDIYHLKLVDFGFATKFQKDHKLNQKYGTLHYMAPEVLLGEYDERCDIYSAGVICYVLLSGKYPHRAKERDEVRDAILRGECNFDTPLWTKISERGKEFIKKLMTLDYNQRVDAETALKDPWLTMADSPDDDFKKKLHGDVFQSLKNHHVKNQLIQAFLVYTTWYLISTQEKKHLTETFKAIDKNGDGFLTREEIVQAYTMIGMTKDIERVDEVLSMVDLNHNGKIDYYEFLAAASNKTQAFTRERLEASFKKFDQDGDGTLSKQELLHVIRGAGGEEDHNIAKLLNEVGTGVDGTITIAEFSDFLRRNFENH